MSQVLKESVRNKIMDAAEKKFSQIGYQKTTMEKIANEAGVATGNIYKYFANKDDLFTNVITEDFKMNLQTITHRRVKELINNETEVKLESMEEGEAGLLLDYWIKNRVKTIIILDKADGSRYESFYKDYIGMITDLSIADNHALRIDNTLLFIFKNKLDDTIRGVVNILKQYEDENEIKKAFEISWTYHYAGIKAVTGRYIK